MRILFMGTPDFAATALKAIAGSNNNYDVVGVVTRVDMPKNRGQKLLPPPVKVAAMELGLPVYQPDTLKDNAILDALKELDPELIIVAAYGKILPEYVLNYPKHGCINIHGSLLPRYRGAAPIQRAIMNGDKEIGITIMYMEKGLDTGDMLLKESLSFDNESFGEIHDALADLGGKMIIEAIEKIKDGSLNPEKQDDALSNYAEKITKEDTVIDFGNSASTINNQIRALSPTPCAIANINDRKIKFVKTCVIDDSSNGSIGEIINVSPKGDGFIDVKTGNGTLRILRLIPEGKKEMSAGDFLRGRGANAGDIFVKVIL